MNPTTFATRRGPATLRLATIADVEALIALNKRCFPAMAEENVVWNRGHLRNHLRVFPDGQFVVQVGEELVAGSASLIVHLGDNPYRPHTYSGITDGGFFHNHDPEGDTLYGADVYVDPSMRAQGLGHQLYEARRQLCRRLNLRRIAAGGRLYNYTEHRGYTPDQYARKVELGELHDPVLSFQLREGFVLRGILSNYINDPRSHNYATFIEWLNPDHRPRAHGTNRKVRVAAMQHQVRPTGSFEEFSQQLDYFVESAASYHADYIVFPEFVTMQLLSQPALRALDPRAGVERLARLSEPYLELIRELARRHGLHIVAGTHPMRLGGQLMNVCPFVFPDGRVQLQPKIHITPGERSYWGISGGSELRLIHTPKAKVGILVCYDSEFPEAARYLSDAGAELIFVPYCTDDRQGYVRVRACSQARAIENQVYVVMAGIVGNLPHVPAMDIHYGRAAVLTPSDFEFARDGVQAEADSNVEMLLIVDLDIDDLHRCRAAGSVQPRLDRRPDLFEFRCHLANDPHEASASQGPPLDLQSDAEPEPVAT